MIYIYSMIPYMIHIQKKDKILQLLNMRAHGLYFYDKGDMDGVTD